ATARTEPPAAMALVLVFSDSVPDVNAVPSGATTPLCSSVPSQTAPIGRAGSSKSSQSVGVGESEPQNPPLPPSAPESGEPPSPFAGGPDTELKSSDCVHAATSAAAPTAMNPATGLPILPPPWKWCPSA